MQETGATAALACPQPQLVTHFGVPIFPHTRAALLLAVVAVSAGAQGGVQADSARPDQNGRRPVRGRVTDHVIVVSIDGLRPDAIARFAAPTLQRLMAEGRYSSSAQTIANSTTLPSHTSMLTGVDSDVHGVYWNDDRRANVGQVTVPTVFGKAHDAGFSTAAFYSKSKLGQIATPRSLDHRRGPAGRLTLWDAKKTAGLVRQYLAKSSPNLVFVHLADADYAGHSYGWMGPAYGNGVRRVDKALEQLLAAADARFGQGRYTLIITADHGGHERTHGTLDPSDTTIPWIVWGAGVQRGDTLTGIRTMDTAATVLWLLGVDVPIAWEGRAVVAAFTPP